MKIVRLILGWFHPGVYLDWFLPGMAATMYLLLAVILFGPKETHVVFYLGDDPVSQEIAQKLSEPTYNGSRSRVHVAVWNGRAAVRCGLAEKPSAALVQTGLIGGGRVVARSDRLTGWTHYLAWEFCEHVNLLHDQ